MTRGRGGTRPRPLPPCMPLPWDGIPLGMILDGQVSPPIALASQPATAWAVAPGRGGVSRNPSSWIDGDDHVAGSAGAEIVLFATQCNTSRRRALRRGLGGLGRERRRRRFRTRGVTQCDKRVGTGQARLNRAPFPPRSYGGIKAHTCGRAASGAREDRLIPPFWAPPPGTIARAPPGRPLFLPWRGSARTDRLVQNALCFGRG